MVENLFLKQKPFQSLLPTVNLFLEQEPVSGVAMNLDVNYRHVIQDNYFKQGETEKTMQEMIFEPYGDSFQNSPIDLIFYEKVIVPVGTKSDDNSAEIASISYCKLSPLRFNQFTDVGVEESAYNVELLLSMKNVTAQWVTEMEYRKLLFIMGMKDYESEVFFQDYKAILSLFNDFDTASEENFKSMLDKSQFPFVYDDETDLASNRLHFKMFFSCLTKIRCAIVEGSHCLESSSRLLQGFSLGTLVNKCR